MNINVPVNYKLICRFRMGSVLFRHIFLHLVFLSIFPKLTVDGQILLIFDIIVFKIYQRSYVLEKLKILFCNSQSTSIVYLRILHESCLMVQWDIKYVFSLGMVLNWFLHLLYIQSILLGLIFCCIKYIIYMAVA